MKKVDVHLKNVRVLVSICLVIHNMCIIFGDTFWKNEWMQETTDELQTEMSHNIGTNTSTNEIMVVANDTLQHLAGIDKNARKSLKYIKQNVVMEFEIAMGTGGKTTKEFSARQNGIAKSLWMTKTKTCIV